MTLGHVRTEPDVEPENFDGEFKDEYFNSTALVYTCSICHSGFSSNNKLLISTPILKMMLFKQKHISPLLRTYP